MADNRPYLYGQLNKQIEYLRYEFNSTDGSIVIKSAGTNNNILDFSVNPENFIKLLQIKKDSNTEDDNIKYYGVFGKNPETGAFDIQLGDTITVGKATGGSGITSIQNIIFGEGDNAVTVEAIVTETGQLQIPKGLPVSVLHDENGTDAEGNTVYIESKLDGNAGGEVY